MRTGGAHGCRALALVTTRDLLPSCLSACRSGHPLLTRDYFLTRYKHKQEHMHNKTHTNTHVQKPAKGNTGVTKDRQCPLVFSLKRNQTKSANHHPKLRYKPDSGGNRGKQTEVWGGKRQRRWIYGRCGTAW